MFIPVHNPDLLSFSTAQYSVDHYIDTSSSLMLSDSYDINMKSFSTKRKLDFLAGRYCALRALELSGVLNITEIPILPNRAPDWPQGWIGSITHTDGFASAAVASLDCVRSIGIDSERLMNSETANEITPLVLLPSEMVLWKSLLQSTLSFESYLTLVFSAKESAYKCFNTIVDCFIDFHDIEIQSVDLYAGIIIFKFVQTFSKNNMGIRFEGRFEITPQLIHTAVELRNCN